MFEEVLADRVRVLGEVHPDTLASRSNLAGAYESAGRLTEAITLLEEVLADSVRVLGADHPPHPHLPGQPRTRLPGGRPS